MSNKLKAVLGTSLVALALIVGGLYLAVADTAAPEAPVAPATPELPETEPPAQQMGGCQYICPSAQCVGENCCYEPAMPEDTGWPCCVYQGQRIICEGGETIQQLSTPCGTCGGGRGCTEAIGNIHYGVPFCD